MDSVLLEQRGHVLVVTLNRPQTLNAWNDELAEQLHDAWVEFERSAARVCVVRSAARIFSSGLDLKAPAKQAIGAMPNISVPCNKPIIAAVEGLALGVACTMLLFTDMVITSESCEFAYPEAQIGGFQGLMGGFPGRLAYKAALQWILTGERTGARHAREMGLVNEVVADGQTFDRAMAIAERIAANAPLVVQAMKAVAMQTMTRGPVELGYSRQMLLNQIATSADGQEGMNAARERRAPRFVGQ